MAIEIQKEWTRWYSGHQESHTASFWVAAEHPKEKEVAVSVVFHLDEEWGKKQVEVVVPKGNWPYWPMSVYLSILEGVAGDEISTCAPTTTDWD